MSIARLFLCNSCTIAIFQLPCSIMNRENFCEIMNWQCLVQSERNARFANSFLRRCQTTTQSGASRAFSATCKLTSLNDEVPGFYVCFFEMYLGNSLAGVACIGPVCESSKLLNVNTTAASDIATRTREILSTLVIFSSLNHHRYLPQYDPSAMRSEASFVLGHKKPFITAMTTTKETLQVPSPTTPNSSAELVT